MAADLPLLNGPSIAPRSGTTRQLVVFLHGYGADGNDLIEIGRAWQTVLPDAAFVSPNAPDLCAESPIGRQWFAIDRTSPQTRWSGVQAAAPALHRFLDEELTRRNLPPTALALVGFSQGTMLALHVGLRRSTPPLAIVGYSGMMIAPNQTDVAAMTGEILSRPQVLLIHGDLDDVVPPRALKMSAWGLKILGIDAEIHMSQGIGHGIAKDGLRLGGAFLANAFNKSG